MADADNATQTNPDGVAAASKKRKTAEPSTAESSSDDDGNVFDESSVEESPPSCICNVWIGGNRMCQLHGHLFEQWIADLPPPADFVMGRPRTPPPKKSSTTAVSASNVIDLISDSNGSSKNTARKNLKAAFENEKEAKATRIDAMLKDARHRSVSSPTFDDEMFIAAFLDPRCRKGLEKLWMIPEQYKDLRDLVLDLMVDVAKETDSNTADNAAGDDDDGSVEAQGASKAGESCFAFTGAFEFNDEVAANETSTEERIRIRCEVQLVAYERSDALPMQDAENNFTDPLKYWKKNAPHSPELAKLAQEYLSIPATSAPSERIWSRAARVITAKRSCIDPAVTSSIMFVQENSNLIHEHWNDLMPNQSLNEFLLPPPFRDIDEDGNPIDAGLDEDEA
mmetsp:Transcript_18751/g.26718  ORF Transcript_18751/g.26718 Transcript_18751/m.26718 type:complete len:396 (-) Transcript_18751:45-1232(-)